MSILVTLLLLLSNIFRQSANWRSPCYPKVYPCSIPFSFPPESWRNRWINHGLTGQGERGSVSARKHQVCMQLMSTYFPLFSSFSTYLTLLFLILGWQKLWVTYQSKSWTPRATIGAWAVLQWWGWWSCGGSLCMIQPLVIPLCSYSMFSVNSLSGKSRLGRLKGFYFIDEQWDKHCWAHQVHCPDSWRIECLQLPQYLFLTLWYQLG